MPFTYLGLRHNQTLFLGFQPLALQDQRQVNGDHQIPLLSWKTNLSELSVLCRANLLHAHPQRPSKGHRTYCSLIRYIKHCLWSGGDITEEALILLLGNQHVDQRKKVA